MRVSAIIRACVALSASAALAACGGMVEAPRKGDAPTFVSLNPCLDAILVEVAEPEQILALSHYSRDPAASSMDVAVAVNFAMTGGTAEEVIAMQPDIVLASSFIAPATKSALERTGLRVETFGSPGSVEESVDQVRALAALAGQEAKGEALAKRIAASVPELRALPPITPKVPGGPRAVQAVLWQPGQIVAGENTLVWELLRRAGFANYATVKGLQQADFVSLEQMVALPPDVLLIAGNEAGQSHPVLAQLNATRIEQFDPSLFYCGGPSIIEASKRLDAIGEGIMLNPPGEFNRDPR